MVPEGYYILNVQVFTLFKQPFPDWLYFYCESISCLNGFFLIPSDNHCSFQWFVGMKFYQCFYFSLSSLNITHIIASLYRRMFIGQVEIHFHILVIIVKMLFIVKLMQVDSTKIFQQRLFAFINNASV